MENFTVTLFVLLLIVAFFYSSVGHGGASGYLALMALFNINPVEMRSSALLLNILVSGIAFFQFYRSGNFRWKIFLPFSILSVPLAFIGANITLDPGIYKIILGLCLAVAALRMALIFGKKSDEKQMQIQFLPALLIGGAIGFISGIIGIGGGILLSPVLIFFRWADLKETAAVSALFILVNSIFGLSGTLYQGASFSPGILLWIAAAAIGGLAGSYYGSRILNRTTLRYLLSAVLIFASVKLIII